MHLCLIQEMSLSKRKVRLTNAAQTGGAGIAEIAQTAAGTGVETAAGTEGAGIAEIALMTRIDDTAARKGEGTAAGTGGAENTSREREYVHLHRCWLSLL